MRYVITVQYDGSGFHGWQKQPNEKETIQQHLEEAIEKITGRPISVTGSGRTDEGVHALGQVAHFDSEKIMPGPKWVAAINFYLPAKIRVIRCEEKPNDFDARKSAKKKTYMYRMYSSPVESPLRAGRETWVKSLDVSAMDRAARGLEGTHDFSSFMTAGSSAKSPVRTIYSASVAREGSSVVFRITGNGFLYNMVRIIAAILMKIGSKEIPQGSLIEIMEQKDRSKALGLAPASALYLQSVEYTD
ncbi:MAG: tRNA pseudouridine(38-40) synthase TruA [Clostridia bacterium]|nr:tRNA pseudouridine(38-40) synthase TruA [Clostridia bacterium]